MKGKIAFSRIAYSGIIFLSFLFFISLTASCATADTASKNEEEAIPHGPHTITEEMTCPVCNMYPAQNTKFQSQIVFKDASFLAFDGVKDLFKYLLNMEGYDKEHSRDDVAVAWVRDFNSGSWIDAKDAHFIIGSDVFGPMGKELIPFSDHMAAMAFKDKHGGMPIHFAEITLEVTDSLDKGEVKMGEHKHKMEGDHKMKMKKEQTMEEHEMEMKHK